MTVTVSLGGETPLLPSLVPALSNLLYLEVCAFLHLTFTFYQTGIPEQAYLFQYHLPAYRALHASQIGTFAYLRWVRPE